jgi:uncharacterized protein (DUF1015 family)
MATVIPFKGIRPSIDKSHLVPSRAVDNYNKSELQTELRQNPFSFLHVVNPDFKEGSKTKPGSDERLQKTKAKFHSLINEKILIQDNKPCYYIYQQNKGANSYTGIIACASIDDYFNGTIKVHEQTLIEREEKLKHYLDICEFNAEPVLFSYPNDTVINQITLKSIQTPPEYDFKTSDKVHHKLWIVKDKNLIFQFQDQFSKIKNIYIADGHHRSASSALLGKSRRSKQPDYTGQEPFNFFLGIFFPETELQIFDFNRVVKDLNHLSPKEFITKVSDKFIITDKGSDIYKPIKNNNFSMYLDGKWYSLDIKTEILKNIDEEDKLDSTILSEHLLSPILNIKNLRNNKRIAFVSGINGMQELKKQVDATHYTVAFGLFPVKIEQLKYFADHNKIMPPKTTWIEPKMRSGLVVYSLEEMFANKQ